MAIKCIEFVAVLFSVWVALPAQGCADGLLKGFSEEEISNYRPRLVLSSSEDSRIVSAIEKFAEEKSLAVIKGVNSHPGGEVIWIQSGAGLRPKVLETMLNSYSGFMGTSDKLIIPCFSVGCGVEFIAKLIRDKFPEPTSRVYIVKFDPAQEEKFITNLDDIFQELSK